MSQHHIIVDSSKVSFRHFTKTTVFKHLRESARKSDFEEACHWVAEIDLSDWQVDLFDFFFTFASTFLLTRYPKISVYLIQKYENFKSIYIDSRVSGIKLYQSQLWKDLWVECLGVLVLSGKEDDLLTLSRIELQQLESLVLKVKSYPIHPWLMVLPEATSREPIHQFLVKCTSIILLHLEAKSIQEALVTLSCIFEYETYVKKSKQKMTCITREMIPRYSDTFSNYKTTTKPNLKKDPCKQDWIWILWDSLELMVSNIHSRRLYQDPAVSYDLLVHTIHSLRGFFELGFHSPSQRKDRLCFLVRAMSIISDFNSTSPSWKTHILEIESAKIVKIATKNIQVMYNDIIDSVNHQNVPTSSDVFRKNSIAVSSDLSLLTNDILTQYPKRSGVSGNPSSLLNTVSVDKLNLMERLDPFL